VHDAREFAPFYKVWLCQPRLTPWRFIALFATVNALVYQAPLWRFVAQHADLTSWEGWSALLSVELLFGGLTIVVLGLLAVLSRRLLKVVSMVLVLGNALALYFIASFHVLLTRAMMGNVFHTDVAEAGALYSGYLLLCVLVLGVLPALWIYRLQWLPQSRLRRLWIAPTAAVVALGGLYANAHAWLWVDDHAVALGGLAQPWSYVGNSIRYWQEWKKENTEPALLPALSEREKIPAGDKQVVVLVIGEAARAANFSLYGYGRATNPELAQQTNLAVLPARSCATYTTASLRCILSPDGSRVADFAPKETLPSYLYRYGVDVEWRTNNFGEPKMHIGSPSNRLQVGDLLARCHASGAQSLSAGDAALCNTLGTQAADGALLLGLGDRIAQSSKQRVFIVLHEGGSHGPLYFKKYPPAFGTFAPVCQTTDLSTCSKASLYNAYDNTIFYTDHVLHGVIQILQAHPEWRSTMLYLSDHGESLGEDGVYLHGMPNMIAPTVQRDIPFLVWRSPAFMQDRQQHGVPEQVLDAYLKPRAAPGLVAAPQAFGHDDIFHSVLGALWLGSSVYQPVLDVYAEPKLVAGH